VRNRERRFPSVRKRFEIEKHDAPHSADSQHVVQVLDSGEDERSGMPFIIVMEFLLLQGDSLKTCCSSHLSERKNVAA